MTKRHMLLSVDAAPRSGVPDSQRSPNEPRSPRLAELVAAVRPVDFASGSIE